MVDDRLLDSNIVDSDLVNAWKRDLIKSLLVWSIVIFGQGFDQRLVDGCQSQSIDHKMQNSQK